MLNWICPDCGRDCAPTSRECPSCVPVGILQTAVLTVESQPAIALSASPDDGHRNGASHEAPQPTPETLQAMVDHLEEQIAVAPAEVVPPVGTPELELDEAFANAFSEAQELHAGELLDLQNKEAARQHEILKIAETFARVPTARLLNASDEAMQPPAPALLSCIALSRPMITIRRPLEKQASVPATPQPLLLAGPILPAELQSLGGRQEPSRLRPKQPHKSGVPTWLISVTVVTVMVLGLASVMQNRPADRGAATPISTAPVATPPAEPAAAAPLLPQHPLARYVEVTGLRVVADLQHRSQLQYIVVNHSATAMSSLALEITVRSSVAQDSDKAPLFHVSAVVTSLGPYQSKEIRTDIDTQLQAKVLPEWENLKVDVQVSEP